MNQEDSEQNEVDGMKKGNVSQSRTAVSALPRLFVIGGSPYNDTIQRCSSRVWGDSGPDHAASDSSRHALPLMRQSALW